MTSDFMAHTIVPIATKSDAVETCDSLEPIVDSIQAITVVHVIEKTKGYPNKAPLETRQEQAERIFGIVEERFADGPPVHRELTYATDVVDGILDTAEEVGATAIGFATHPGGRLRRVLSGNDSYRLTTESTQPVVVESRLDDNGIDG